MLWLLSSYRNDKLRNEHMFLLYSNTRFSLVITFFVGKIIKALFMSKNSTDESCVMLRIMLRGKPRTILYKSRANRVHKCVRACVHPLSELRSWIAAHIAAACYSYSLWLRWNAVVARACLIPVAAFPPCHGASPTSFALPFESEIKSKSI